VEKPAGNRPRQRPVQDLELFADERCSKAILDFLATTEVGRTARPPVADEEPGSEASEKRDTLHGWRRKRGRWERGRKIRGRGVYRLSFLSLFLIFHVNRRGGHIVTGTLGGSVVAGKRLCNLFIGMMKQKNMGILTACTDESP